MLDPNLEKDPAVRAYIEAQAAATAWSRGKLRYKLHETQEKIDDALAASPYREHFLLCSRRLGKSFELVVRAIEQAVQFPGSRILYLAPYGKDAVDIANDLVTQITKDCPKNLLPEYKAQTKELHFPNGSIIRLKGVNGEHAQYLRGGAADLVLLDEAGLMDDLLHVLNDVVAPMTLTTQGKIIIATTPPRSPGHDSALIYERLAGMGCVSVFTLRDAPHILHADKVDMLRRVGEKVDRIEGILDGTLRAETTTALREFFCEFVTDASTAVVPNFADDEKHVVKVVERPPFFDSYVSVDPGFQDRTGILYGYFDFKRGALVIEDEALLIRASTQDIAKELLDREYALWKDKKPFLRVVDDDLRMIADLYERHQLVFTPARKEDSLGAVNLMITMITTREVIINPRCVNLLRQLKNATWNKQASDFARASQSSPDGHYDLVAALKYMCRTVNRHKNPYPPGYFIKDRSNMHYSTKGIRQKASEQLGLLDDTPAGRKLAKKSRQDG